jgi:hypothetical protein
MSETLEREIAVLRAALRRLADDVITETLPEGLTAEQLTAYYVAHARLAHVPPTLRPGEAEEALAILHTLLRVATETRQMQGAQGPTGPVGAPGVQGEPGQVLIGTMPDPEWTYAPAEWRPAVPALSAEALDRLCWLLSLSPGERSFVGEAADAAHTHDLPRLWDGLAVFADWLEEQGAPAGSVRRLAPQTGDVLVFSYAAKGLSPEQRERNRNALMEHTQFLCAHLAKQGREVTCIIQAEDGNFDVQHLPVAQMRAAGWVPADEARALAVLAGYDGDNCPLCGSLCYVTSTASKTWECECCRQKGDLTPMISAPITKFG